MTVLPQILVLINILRHKREGDAIYYDQNFWNVQAIASLTLWLESLYYLRSFDATGYLVHSL